MKLDYIEWLDHYTSNHSWTNIGEVDLRLLKCTSVGFVLKEDKNVVVICQNMDPSKEINSNHMTILKKCIVVRKTLKTLKPIN